MPTRQSSPIFHRRDTPYTGIRSLAAEFTTEATESKAPAHLDEKYIFQESLHSNEDSDVLSIISAVGRRSLVTELEASLAAGNEALDTLKYARNIDPGTVAYYLLTEGFEGELLNCVKSCALTVSSDVVLCVLSLQRLDVAVQITQITGSGVLAEDTVLQRLIELFQQSEVAVQVLYLLYSIAVEDWSTDTIAAMLQALSSAVQGGSPITASSNPLLVCISACELCKKLAKWRRTTAENFQTLADSFTAVAAEIQKQYSDYGRLKPLYLEKGFGNYCIFDLITARPDEYRPLLMSGTVVSIVHTLWRGEDEAGYGLEQSCLFFPYYRQTRTCNDLWRPVIVPKMKKQSVFQFTHWKRDGFIRHVTEATILLCLFGVLVYLLDIYLSIVKILNDGRPTSTEAREAMSRLTLQSYVRYAYTAYCFALLCNHLQGYTRQRLLGQPLMLDPRFFLDVLVAGVLVLVDIAGDSDFFMTRLSTQAMSNLVESLYALLFLLNGLRVCMIFLQTETFGPILRMIYLISRSIFAYLVVYLLCLVSFSLMFTVLFWREAPFESVELSLRTLFTWSVGGFDLSFFQERRLQGSVLGCVWIGVSSMLLLNLLIAVLASRHEQLSPQAKADYAAIVYRIYTLGHFEEQYGALIVGPTPINLLTLFSLPLYLFLPKRSRQITSIFSVISYQPMFILGMLLHTLYSVLLLPLTYLLVCGRLLRSEPLRTKHRVVQWIFFGPFKLCALWLQSYTVLAKYLYSAPNSAHARDSTAFLQPLRVHVSRVLAVNPLMREVPLASLLSSVRRLPRWESLQLSNSQFLRLAERIYFSAPVHSDVYWSIKDLLTRCAYRDRLGQEVVDLQVLSRLLKDCQPEILHAINFELVKSALQTAERRRVKYSNKQ